MTKHSFHLFLAPVRCAKLSRGLIDYPYLIICPCPEWPSAFSGVGRPECPEAVRAKVTEGERRATGTQRPLLLLLLLPLRIIPDARARDKSGMKLQRLAGYLERMQASSKFACGLFKCRCIKFVFLSQVLWDVVYCIHYPQDSSLL